MGYSPVPLGSSLCPGWTCKHGCTGTVSAFHALVQGVPELVVHPGLVFYKCTCSCSFVTVNLLVMHSLTLIYTHTHSLTPQFRYEEDAEKAVLQLNNRWFNGLPIHAELSPVTDFREACCRQYEMR